MLRRLSLLLVWIVPLAVSAGALASPAAAATTGIEYETANGTVEATQSAELSAGCPEGKESAGGGVSSPELGNEGISATTSQPEGSSWGAFVETGGNFGKSAFRVETSCLPTRAFGNTEEFSQSTHLGARLDPTQSSKRTWTMSCPAGQQILMGGFEVEKLGGVVVSAKNAVVSTSIPDPEGNGWTTTAQNFQYVEGVNVDSSARCVTSQFARGLLDIHYYLATDVIEEGNVPSECPAGQQALGGGFRSSRGNSFWANTQFAPDDHGYEAWYDSTHTGSADHVAVAVTCVDPVTSYVGGLEAEDFQRFCEDEFSDREEVKAVEGKTATGWACSYKGGGYVIGGNVAAVCHNRYYRGYTEEFWPKAIYENLNAPLSWQCWAAEQKQTASEVEGEIVPEAQASDAPPGASPRRKVLRISGRVRLPQAVSRGATKIELRNLALERSARGELITAKHRFAPRPLLHRVKGGKSKLTFAGGSSPRIKLTLKHRRGRSFDFELTARGGRFQRPLLCRHAPRTELTTRFLLLRHEKALADVRVASPWRCHKGRLVTERR